MEMYGGTQRARPWASWIGSSVITMVMAFAFQGEAQAQAQFTSSSSDVADVTYAKDVAPIILNNCVVCHRPGGIGPMELLT